MFGGESHEGSQVAGRCAGRLRATCRRRTIISVLSSCRRARFNLLSGAECPSGRLGSRGVARPHFPLLGPCRSSAFRRRSSLEVSVEGLHPQPHVRVARIDRLAARWHRIAASPKPGARSAVGAARLRLTWRAELGTRCPKLPRATRSGGAAGGTHGRRDGGRQGVRPRICIPTFSSEI